MRFQDSAGYQDHQQYGTAQQCTFRLAVRHKSTPNPGCAMEL